MNRDRTHKDVDKAIADMLKAMDKKNYNHEQDFVAAVNMLDKVYRPFLHVITDAEFDKMDHRSITFAMVELCVSMTTQMATRVIPSDDGSAARSWYHQVAKAMTDGMAASCNTVWPPVNDNGDTLQ